MSGSSTSFDIATTPAATFAALGELVAKYDESDAVAITDLHNRSGAVLFNFYDDALAQINEVFTGVRTATAIDIGTLTMATLTTTGNASIGGTLGVTGATTLSSLDVTSNATVGGTLGVTGAATLSSGATLSSASPTLTIGNGTGSPSTLYSKADASLANVWDLRNGGAGLSERRWTCQWSTAESLIFYRYDALGTLLDAPLTLAYSTGVTTLTSLTVTGNTTLGDATTDTTSIYGTLNIANPAAGNIGMSIGSSTQTVNVHYDKVGTDNQNVMHMRSGGANSHIVQHGSDEYLRIYSYNGGTLSGTTLAIGPTGNMLIGYTGSAIGFMGAAAVTRPTVSGSRAGNAALDSLLTQLATLGLITNSTTA